MSSHHGKKTTIHVTNIIKDKAELKQVWETNGTFLSSGSAYSNKTLRPQLFSTYPGFLRISFHQDYVFICFSSTDHSTSAIDRIHNTTDMLAAYAKHGVASNTTPSISVPPNPILYVSVFPYFTEAELMKIFRGYEGFDSCRFFPNHALVRFSNVDYSKRALEDLNGTTNLFANYSTKGAKTVPGSSKSSQQQQHQQQQQQPSSPPPQDASSPKCTIHVTNLDRTIPLLLSFFKLIPGFKRAAFYVDYAFVIFYDAASAGSAIEDILFGTKMKASFAKAEYSPHSIPVLGVPNSLLRVCDYPACVSEEELRTFFGELGGDVTVYQSSCLVKFGSVEEARKGLEVVNSLTNFTAVYSRKGVAGSGALGRNGSVASIVDHVPFQPTEIMTHSHVVPAVAPAAVQEPAIESVTTSLNNTAFFPSPESLPSVLTNTDAAFNQPLHASIFATHDITAPISTSPHSLNGMGESGTNLSDRTVGDEEGDDEEDARGGSAGGESKTGLLGVGLGDPVHPAHQGLDVNQPAFFPEYLSKPGDIPQPQGLQQQQQPPLLPLHQSLHQQQQPLIPFLTQQPQQQQHQHQQQQQQQPFAPPPTHLENQFYSAKSFLDSMFHRLLLLESENATLRRLQQQQQQQQAPSAPVRFRSDIRTSSDASSTSSGGEDDWKGAYERAVEEVEGLREEVRRWEEAYGRLEKEHKNCGYLQGLLAICD
ncbi:hypothetical protein HDU97_009878 [Phlyctochytrium planicorne]|nr:hypothetical protein HDU97_009878 [Phlyctochytrium planicorne]